MRLTLFSALVLMSVLFGWVHAQSYAPSTRADVAEYVDWLVAEQGFDRATLNQLMSDAQKRQDIRDLMSRPAERVLTWQEYRNLFITEQRIQGGREFMREHAQTLARAEAEYGVPAEVITAILGVETSYGRNKGRHRVIDALMTLSFDYPQDTPRDRSAFFRNQLTEFLRLTRDQGVDPRMPMGSYAGAMGYPQFIPTSYRDFAVDFSGDGLIDIWNNPVDAIGSIANYFHAHNWRPGEAVLVEARLRGDAASLPDLRRNRFDRMALTDAEAAGMEVIGVAGLNARTQVIPMAFALGDQEIYKLGLHNFYVITRYNHSRMYALAVHQLSEALRSD